MGQITTMISADATRLDRFSGLIHKYVFRFNVGNTANGVISLWVAPIQVRVLSYFSFESMVDQMGRSQLGLVSSLEMYVVVPHCSGSNLYTKCLP